MLGGTRGRSLVAMIRSGAAYAVIPLVGLVSAPLMAQALGPIGRGELAAILQPLTVAGAFASFGLPAAVTYFVGAGYDRRGVTRRAFSLASVAVVLVGIVLAFYAPTIADVSHQPLWFVALIWLSIVPGAYVAIRRSTLQADGRYGALDGERATSGVLRLALVVMLFVFGVTSAGPFTAAYTIAGIAAMVWLLIPFGPVVRDPARPVASAAFTRFAMMSSIGVVATTLNNRLDQAILPAAMSAAALGIYSVAVTVAELPYVVTAVTMRNLLSEASRGVGSEQLRLTFLIGQSLVMVGCAILIVLTPWLIPSFFGAAFVSGVPVTIVLLVSTLFGSAAQNVCAIMAGLGVPGVSSLAPLIGAVLTVVGLVIFWMSMSALVAAWISLVSQAIVFVIAGVSLAVLQRRRGSSRRKGLVS